MTISKEIQRKLEAKLGKDIRLSADCVILALDIEQSTHQHIGVNTLKRLLGFIHDEREPRVSTLDIVANYLGYNNWDTLIDSEKASNSDFQMADGGIDVSLLPIHSKIQIEYYPNRKVIMEYQGEFIFLILASENSKLQVNDVIEVHHIIPSFPLIVPNVIRDGKQFGLFTAGKASGLSSVTII